MQQEKRNEESWGPRRLPILHIEGRAYFVDLRLHELRAVNDVDVAIDLRSPAGQAAVEAWKAIHCPTCGQLTIVRRDDPAEVIGCRRCGQAVVVQGGIALA
jgi:hypothetical protein